jgi:hypothetical protein
MGFSNNLHIEVSSDSEYSKYEHPGQIPNAAIAGLFFMLIGFDLME